MTRFYKQRANLAFLLMAASGDRSFEEITVAASETPYESGTILVKGVDGVYAALTAADVTPSEEGDVDVEIAILAARTVFQSDDEATDAPALAVVRDATVKSFELGLPEDVTVADVQPYLERQGLILRG